MRPPDGPALRPVSAGERIEELDVVRGFALIGVFLMNVEFFNRSLVGLMEGMPRDLTGLDWFASWFITYFVQGKFWTIFSLLFGMGFAVMLTRAERGQRPFLVPYLRRILALSVFGSLHFLFLWSGDILFSYAVGAGGLLILLYGRWRPIVAALVLLIGLAFVPGLAAAGRVAGSLAFIGLIALYLRGERRIGPRGPRLPLFSLLFLILGVLGAIVSIALWVLDAGGNGPRLPVTIISALLLITAVLSAKYHDPVELRSLRLGVSIYVVPTLLMIALGTVRYVSPPDPGTAAEQAERAESVAKLKEKKANEERVLSSGTYAEVVAMRARELPEKVADDTSLAVIAMAMFLIGVWFVRSGVMENTRAHRPLFRRLACYGVPLGIGLGLLGSLIATSRTLDDTSGGFRLASGLSMLGSLPASLGYVSLVVLALHSNTALARIRVLAPVGRMALTNYLLQSLISTSFFYGYAGGQWGLSRAWQVVFVAGVFSLQIAFSHWWLARFRYGPMEWVWRAFTYRQIPPMRLSQPAA